MKRNLTPRYTLVLLISLVCISFIQAQFVGIGTSVPDYKLHIVGNTSAILKLENISTLNTNIPTYLMFKTGTHFTGSIQTIGTSATTARLGLFTNAGTTTSTLQERLSINNNGNVGIGTTTPAYPLDVNGRVRVRYNGGTSGIYFMDDLNTNNRGFVGMENNNSIGFYGSGGASWGLTMNVTTGAVFIPGKLTVQNDQIDGAVFSTNSNDTDARAIYADASFAPGIGQGVHAEGGAYGVHAEAGMQGAGSRVGVWASGTDGSVSNYGVYAVASGGQSNYGIYAEAAGNDDDTWAGYFAGDVLTITSYQTSDRKFKNNIQPVHNALKMINELKPSTYSFKTMEYKQMALPHGNQYGLIADEVKQVFPDLVKKAKQPAKYENNDIQRGKKLTEEIDYEAVNYTGLIPVLIASVQELEAKIEILERRLAEKEEK